MEIKIDIDMDKINYNAINEKLLEKINDGFIEEAMRRFYLKDDEIKDLIQNKVLSAANEYIDRGYYYTSAPSRYAKEIAIKVLTDRLNKEIDSILDEIGKDTLRKTIVDAVPSAVLNALCKRIDQNLYQLIDSAEYKIKEDMRVELYNRLSQKGIML